MIYVMMIRMEMVSIMTMTTVQMLLIQIKKIVTKTLLETFATLFLTSLSITLKFKSQVRLVLAQVME